MFRGRRKEENERNLRKNVYMGGKSGKRSRRKKREKPRIQSGKGTCSGCGRGECLSLGEGVNSVRNVKLGKMCYR